VPNSNLLPPMIPAWIEPSLQVTEKILYKLAGVCGFEIDWAVDLRGNIFVAIGVWNESLSVGTDQNG
jgi:hypothetical protein